jgi:hypothetical protein
MRQKRSRAQGERDSAELTHADNSDKGPWGRFIINTDVILDLTGNRQPGHSQISDYRRSHLSDVITGSGSAKRRMGTYGNNPQPARGVEDMNCNGLMTWFMSQRLQSDIPKS